MTQSSHFTNSKDLLDATLTCRLLPNAIVEPVPSVRAFDLESLDGLDLEILDPRDDKQTERNPKQIEKQTRVWQ